MQPERLSQKRPGSRKRVGRGENRPFGSHRTNGAGDERTSPCFDFHTWSLASVEPKRDQRRLLSGACG